MTTLALLSLFLFALITAAAVFPRDALARDRAKVNPRVIGEPASAGRWSNHVNRNLIRIARCETGGINRGRPLWTHRARSEHAGLDYEGALGFLETTWEHYRHRVRPLPPAEAWRATPAEQLAVGRVLVAEFHGYSSWPACSRRLGLR